MNNITTFIYNLNKLGFTIWLENEKIQYVQYKECSIKNKILNEIKFNRKKIIEHLKINNCYTPKNINEHYIYITTSSENILSFAQS